MSETSGMLEFMLDTDRSLVELSDPFSTILGFQVALIASERFIEHLDFPVDGSRGTVSRVSGVVSRHIVLYRLPSLGCAVAEKFYHDVASVLDCRLLVADDTVNPYAYLALTGAGWKPFALDPIALDERNEFTSL